MSKSVRVPVEGFDGDWIEVRHPDDVKTRVWVAAGRAEKALLAYEGSDGATRLELRGATLAALLPIISAHHVTDVDSGAVLQRLDWGELTQTQTIAILTAIKTAFSDEGETAPDPTETTPSESSPEP